MSPETLIGFWQTGVVTPHRKPFGDRIMPAFDRNELMQLSGQWHDRIEPQTFANRTGLSLHGIEQLIAGGTLAATAPSLPGKAPNITSAEIADFLARVQANAHTAVDEPITLKESMFAVGGRQKPWGPAFECLLGGRIAYVLLDGEALLVDRILVSRSMAKQIGSLCFDRAAFPKFQFSNTMVQREALSTLNISATGTRVLKGLAVSGTTTQIYQVADVERRAREVITISEIAFALGVTLPVALRRLRDAKLKPTMPGAWLRKETEREMHRF